MRNKLLTGAASALGILMLILDAKTALRGATEAVDLCLHSVIPSIFPFLVLSGLLTSAINGSRSRLLNPLGQLLGVPKGSEGIFLTGILGGYPTGAQAVHRAWKLGELTTLEAKRMLGFCSNAGPSFIFGILILAFPNMWMLWLLWGIHIASAILTAVTLPCESHRRSVTLTCNPMTLSKCLTRSVVTMGYICGWIVLFRIILAFCDRWVFWLLPKSVQVILYGITELANGCCNLSNISSIGMRFVICSAVLAFGGICVAMQTVTITEDLGLGWYFPGKALQMLYSIALSYPAQGLLFAPAERWSFHPIATILPVLLIAAVTLLMHLPKKRVAFLL